MPVFLFSFRFQILQMFYLTTFNIKNEIYRRNFLDNTSIIISNLYTKIASAVKLILNDLIALALE